MLKFLGQQAIFKAVPRPTLRYCNRMAPRWVHTSQGGEDVSGGGINGSLEFWLGRLDKERQDMQHRFEKERQYLQHQFEKERQEFKKERQEFQKERQDFKKERQENSKDFLNRFEKQSQEIQGLVRKIVTLKV
jgi:delta 1-pyrroline-5-carboxylate dehydrogenase